ncbi:hypothetical protein ACIQ9P_03060 [Kitasatospora sp. NPDC094019]|uniref:hypothetical protein n=1 Tax=Kitasatospora sp. NPDC094019 TaxID=3364091 RepID=UPI00382270DE
MTDQHNTAPAVWDPTARGGAGGWVRGPQQPATPGAPPAAPPAAPGPPQGPPGGPAQAPPPAGPYGEDAPTALIPQPVPPRPDAPGAFPPRSAPQQQPPYGPPRPAQQPGYGGAPYSSPGRPPQGHPRPEYAQPGYAAEYPPEHPQSYPQQDYPQQPWSPLDHPTGYEDADDDAPGSRRAPLLIAFALLFVLALGGGILWAVRDKGSGTDQAGSATPSATATGGSGNPQPAPLPTGSGAEPTPTGPDPSASASPSPSASTAGANAPAQAKALDELLTQGEGAKAPIGNAVAKVNSCPTKPDIESAAQVFDSGAKQRDQLLAKLAQLGVTDLPGGADAVQSLKSAWQLSADIDRAYAAWARAVAAQGCSGSAPNTADKKRADELNPQATQAKKDFVTKWKAIADQFGLTPRTQDRI